MSTSLSQLRRLAEHHSYDALHDACLEEDAAQPAVQVLLALACAHLDRADEARRLLTAVDACSLDPAARIDLAAVHMALDETDRAAALLENELKAVAETPASTRALLLARLGWCRLRQGRAEEAALLYEQSLELAPCQAAYHNLLGLYRDSGRLDDMAACLTAAEQFWAHERHDWPDTERAVHDRRLRELRLDYWLAQDQLDAAESWLANCRNELGAPSWCELVSAFAERLAAGSRHAQAEEWLRTGLKHHPDSFALYEQLAELAGLQGRVPQAVALLRHAIARAAAGSGPTASLWLRLAETVSQADPALARTAVDRARQAILDAADDADPVPGDLHTRLDLASADVLVRERRYDEAERGYRSLIEQQPEPVQALQRLGQLLLQLGRLDEAVALFERAEDLEPGAGYGGLMTAHRYPDDEATLERLEAVARTPGAEGTVRAGLLFRLAAAWEQRQEYDRAFALADEANAARRALLSYDPQAHRQHCARLRHAFPRALFEHRPDCGHESTLPVFVVGMPRSGTTLVEQMLAGHSRIHGAGELGTIPRVIAGLERWERQTGSGRRYPDCVDDLDPKVTRGIAGHVLEELREYSADADHVVDKLPHNFENIGLIRLLFPRARIISVRRDPRDIAVSNYFVDYVARHGGMGFAYHLDWIGEQLADHNLLMHHWHQVFPDDILEIDYEALIDDPKRIARRLLDYIGVDWEPAVLRFDALERPVSTASVWQVRQPLYATSRARWRHYQQHLQPLIEATNRRIGWEPIDMATLPEPGWLNTGVDLFRSGDLDAAEYRFKLLLHHLPEHAAAAFMLGVTYVRKGYLSDGIALMRRALVRCPWNQQWRRDLIRACRLDGRDAEAAALGRGLDRHSPGASGPPEQAASQPLDFLFLSGETTCATATSATP